MKNEFLMNLKLEIKSLIIIQHRSGAKITRKNGIFLRELIEFKFNTKLNVKDMIFKKKLSVNIWQYLFRINPLNNTI
jgi:hypothetical protein